MTAYYAWHRGKCAEYRNDFPIYEEYARTLEKILKEVCAIYAPLAIVQARAKAFSSFAEKMARKADKYMTRNIGPTDLCGARVITETQAEVDRISGVIRELFVIDEENSPDVRTRLKSNEFGYLSVHYVVQIKRPEILGVKIPPAIGERKAEIQVRTLLQHAWGSICHDRLYKASFRVPEHLGRDLARVAALLEEADGQFGAAISALDAYKIHYGAYMDKERLAAEQEILQTVLDNEPELAKKPAAALRLAQVARATGDWVRVEALLNPYIPVKGKYQFNVLAEHGHALCRHCIDPTVPSYAEGLQEIEQAVEGAQGDLQTRALGYRAWASARIPDNEETSRKHFRAAYEADPHNPFHLASHIEYELYCGEPFGIRAVTGLALRDAVKTCRAYADAGIELPWAYLTMGRLHLLLDDVYASLSVYAKAIRLCLTGEGSTPEDVFDTELRFLRHINRGRPLPETHDWVHRLLAAGKTAQILAKVRAGLAAIVNASKERPLPEADDPEAWQTFLAQMVPGSVVRRARNDWRAWAPLVAEIKQMCTDHPFAESDDSAGRQNLIAGILELIGLPTGLAAKRGNFKGSVVILAGGTSPLAQPAVDSVSKLVQQAFAGFNGTIISGGTTAGVAGLAGSLRAVTAGAEVLGYIPRNLPYDQPIDVRYTAHVPSPGASYGAGDPLQYWIDLLLSQVQPKDVRVLGIDGGPIAGFEYRLALALGATVGLLEPLTRSAATLQQDPDWNSDPSLLTLPADVMTLRAFVRQPRPELTPEQVETAAKTLHERFLTENRYKNPDLAMQPWTDLREDFKDSNRMQASRMIEFLKVLGFRVEAAQNPIATVSFTADEVEQLAEMEHGRWNVEKLLSGWKYGAKRDPVNKLSPYLVPWNKLTEEVRKYDRDAVTSWPTVLAAAGLRVARRERVSPGDSPVAA
jgi:ppGpp synthetase/RelA/SpoT-type nucleotidyltranferase